MVLCDRPGRCKRETEPRPAHQVSRAHQPTFFKQPRASALAASQFPPVLTEAKDESASPPAGS